MVYFIFNGLLISVVVYSIANALQHPGLRESSLNSYFTLITLVCSFSFDNWVLLVGNKVAYFTNGVIGLILAMLAGYFCLQSYKQKQVQDKVQEFIN